MTAEREGIVDRVRGNVEETKEGIEETYEERPGHSAGEKVKGVFKEAAQDAKEARDLDEDEDAE